MKSKIGRIVRWVYRYIMRPALIKAIDDPNTDVDDFVIEVLDKLFKY